MEKETKRALRRHHLRRLKDKCSNKHVFLYASNDSSAIGKFAHTRAICSCTMCGNPRRHFKQKTIQEMSFEELNNNN